MSNAKPQMSKKIQTSKIRILVLNFDIDLTFACLREAAPAKAGILKFGFINLTLFLHKSNSILSRRC
jgi:hypothetical protein